MRRVNGRSPWRDRERANTSQNSLNPIHSENHTLTSLTDMTECTLVSRRWGAKPHQLQSQKIKLDGRVRWARFLSCECWQLFTALLAVLLAMPAQAFPRPSSFPLHPRPLLPPSPPPLPPPAHSPTTVHKHPIPDSPTHPHPQPDPL